MLSKHSVGTNHENKLTCNLAKVISALRVWAIQHWPWLRAWNCVCELISTQKTNKEKKSTDRDWVIKNPPLWIEKRKEKKATTTTGWALVCIKLRMTPWGLPLVHILPFDIAHDYRSLPVGKDLFCWGWHSPTISFGSSCQQAAMSFLQAAPFVLHLVQPSSSIKWCCDILGTHHPPACNQTILTLQSQSLLKTTQLSTFTSKTNHKVWHALLVNSNN